MLVFDQLGLIRHPGAADPTAGSFESTGQPPLFWNGEPKERMTAKGKAWLCGIKGVESARPGCQSRRNVETSSELTGKEPSLSRRP